MNNKLAKTWKEAVVAQLEISRHMPGDTEGYLENSQDN
jgi:hypothetical protein